MPERVPGLIKDIESIPEINRVFKTQKEQVDKILSKHNEGLNLPYKQIVEVSKEIQKIFTEEQKKAANKKLQEMEGNGDGDKVQMVEGKEMGELTDKQKQGIGKSIEATTAKLDAEEQQQDDQKRNSKPKLEDIPKLKINDAFKNINSIEIIDAEIKPRDSSTFRKAKILSNTLERNLAFLNSRYNRVSEMYEQDSGELDEDELYSLKSGNTHVFYEEEPARGWNLDLMILIDESGSMGCDRKIGNARIAAMALVMAFQHQKHVNMFVYGHTSDLRSTWSRPKESAADVTLFKYWDSIDNFKNFNALNSIEARSNNADGFAIQKCGQLLDRCNSNQKLMIVISDGQPHSSGYGGSSAINHVKNVVDDLERKGTMVVQICIDNIEDSPKMFQHYVPYNGDGKLGQQLKQLLMKKLVMFANEV